MQITEKERESSRKLILKLSEGNLNITSKENFGTIIFQVNKQELLDLVKTLKELFAIKLISITSCILEKQFILFYIFNYRSIDNTKNGQNRFYLLPVKTKITLQNAEIYSLTKDFPSAMMYEREITLYSPIKFLDQIQFNKAILPEELLNDVYENNHLNELIKNQIKTALIEIKRGVLNRDKFNCWIVNKHPEQKESFQFQFLIKNDIVQVTSLRLGLSYSPFENKLKSNSWLNNLQLIEKLFGVCSVAHHLAYCGAIESIALSSDIPIRSKWIRVLVAELERIQNHLLWFGLTIHNLGMTTIFQNLWIERKKIMDILEKISGKRFNYSIIIPGGVKNDINPNLTKIILTQLKKLKSILENSKNEIEESKVILTKGIANLSYDDAIKLCTVGPMARASAIQYDIRKNSPYLIYDEIPFDVINLPNGDMYDNIKLKFLEMFSSIDICVFALDNLPNGPISRNITFPIQKGSSFSLIEAPGGELYYYIASNGRNSPFQIKIRPPTIANIPTILHRLKGTPTKFIPIILRGIEMGIDPLEKVTFIDERTNKVKVLQGQKYRQLATQSVLSDGSLKLFY